MKRGDLPCFRLGRTPILTLHQHLFHLVSLLDPYAYDGQVDPVTQQPHGYGVKLDDFAGGKELLYEGLWKNGEPHGTGRLVDNRSGDICYIGGWKAGRR